MFVTQKLCFIGFIHENLIKFCYIVNNSLELIKFHELLNRLCHSRSREMIRLNLKKANKKKP